MVKYIIFNRSSTSGLGKTGPGQRRKEERGEKMKKENRLNTYTLFKYLKYERTRVIKLLNQ